MLQYATGKILFLGDGWMASLYLIGFALAIATGRQAAAVQKWIDALFFAIIIAAVVSVGLQVMQWLDIKGSDPWVRDLPPNFRPFANLGQPNNLSTLLCWGLIGLWNAYLTRRATGPVVMLLAAAVLFGIALAQSRTAWLVLGCFIAFSIVFHRRLEVRRYRLPLALLAGFFLLSHLCLNVVGPTLGRAPSRTLHEQLEAGTRVGHWKSMIAAIGERFWTGWGWEQVSVAQQTMAPSLPPVPELLGYSHDLFLDLLVWNGVPLGAALIAAICGWLYVTARRLQAAPELLLLLAIMAVLIHSLLEYPHAYAFFLLPTGLMVGAVSHREVQVQPGSIVLAKPWVALAVCLLGAATALTVVDYLHARANYDTLRFEMAHVGPNRNSKPPHLRVLTGLQALATTDRMPLVAQVSDADYQLFSKVSRRYPAERNLMQFAVLAAGRGDEREARTTLVRLCKLYPVERCEFARQVWASWSTTRYPWLRNVSFPTPGDAG